jgi:asparagine synthase (glutamine-hydrolysing)
VSYLDDQGKDRVLADRALLLDGERPCDEHAFLGEIRDRCASRSMADAAALVDLQSFLPCNVLAYGDRMSMAHALEVRVPFCDHLLVERLAGLPATSKMPLGVQKGLFRWSLRSDLPATIALHKKMGFNPPISAWLRGPLARLLAEHFGRGALEATAILSPTGVTKLRHAFESGHGEVGHVLWSLLVLEAWLAWVG